MSKGRKAMGKALVDIEVSNGGDLDLVGAGTLAPEKVRRVQLKALVDAGAMFLALPESIVRQLGLRLLRKMNTRFGNGHVEARPIYGGAQLEVNRRAVTTDVLACAEGTPPLLGQIPLEGLDFVVDSKNQRLMPNPEAPDPEMGLAYVL